MVENFIRDKMTQKSKRKKTTRKIKDENLEELAYDIGDIYYDSIRDAEQRKKKRKSTHRDGLVDIAGDLSHKSSRITHIN